MDTKQQKAFLKAMEEMVEEKGISKDVIVDAISEAFKVAYNKKLSDELLVVNRPIRIKKIKKVVQPTEDGETPVDPNANKLADALIRSDIDLEKGKIEIYRQWKVVKEDDLTDDFVEISDEDSRVKSNKLKVGDFYEEPLSFDDFSKGDVNRFISAYKQKISRSEKENLLETFKGKIGELITGVCEKSDEHSVIVNLGRISVTLFQKDLIGHETFKPGDQVKVYVCGISKDDSKIGSLIHCSRSCPEFLEKLFANEVREIYDGTVKIYKVARLAGIRSKVAVYSEDANIDASGACIGQNGSRIQSIVSQLGNDRNAKEKIDVIEYSKSLGIFLRECLKPGVVIGCKFEDNPEGGQNAYVICQNETGSAAIGFKGTNVILARLLTGLKEIKIFDESAAKEKGIDFTPMSVYEVEERELEKEKFRQESIKNAEINANKAQNVVEVAPVTGDEDLDEGEEEETSVNEAATSNETEAKPVANENLSTEKVAEEVKPTEEVKQAEATKPVEEVKQAPIEVKEEPKPEFHEVKTTTTLDQLEASLENEKKNSSYHKDGDKKFKKPFYKHNEKQQAPVDDTVKPVIDEKNKMSIYTAEELAEMEKEEKENKTTDTTNESDEDYSEYDSDEYYNK